MGPSPCPGGEERLDDEREAEPDEATEQEQVEVPPAAAHRVGENQARPQSGPEKNPSR